MIQKTVRDGEQFPTLYRIAWYDFPRRRAVCYPIGIRWIAWAVRYLWMLTYKQTRPDAWERACHDVAEKAKAEVRERWKRDNAQSAENAQFLFQTNATYHGLVETLVSLMVGKPMFTEWMLHEAVAMAQQRAVAKSDSREFRRFVGESHPMCSDGADCA